MNNSVLIPWFDASEIVAIENNINIFVLNEDAHTPRNVIRLRRRTNTKIMECLCKAGMDSADAHRLVSETHGFYLPMKKRIFNGACQNNPVWVDELNYKAKITCLLVGKWEETDGDKLIIDTLYGHSYAEFIEQIIPYTKGEDPLLCMSNNGRITYYLTSVENTWDTIDFESSEPIWENFIQLFKNVINEDEKLFKYDPEERFLAQIRGESLFWSETIRQGMLRTLIMMGIYKKKNIQVELDRLIEWVLSQVDSLEKWKYISRFWVDICEISPRSVLEKLAEELINPSGLLQLFETDNNNSVLFSNHPYINILLGVEQLLIQKDYYWEAFHWLICLDKHDYTYPSNPPSEIFGRVFCIWQDLTGIRSRKEKCEAAEIAMRENPQKTWDYLFEALNQKSIMVSTCIPRYREYCDTKVLTYGEINELHNCYVNLLLNNTNCLVERWERLIQHSDLFSEREKNNLFDKLKIDMKQMNEMEQVTIKNKIREKVYFARYFSDSKNTLKSDEIETYLDIFYAINCDNPEFEYLFLFQDPYGFPLLNPTPINEDTSYEENVEKRKTFISEKICEFRNRRLNLDLLISICSNIPNCILGILIAKYWDDGKWNEDIFYIFLNNNTDFALQYLEWTEKESVDIYKKAIKTLNDGNFPDHIKAMAYRIEAKYTDTIPLVDKASDEIKRQFWSLNIILKQNNIPWGLEEEKKYSSFENHVVFLYELYRNNLISIENVYHSLLSFDNHRNQNHSQWFRISLYELLKVLDNEYLYNEEKCVEIARMEFLFWNYVEHGPNKCLSRVLKRHPDFLADIIAIINKKYDGADNENYDFLSSHAYHVYQRLKFCPAEENGNVDENELDKWIQNFEQSMIGIGLEDRWLGILGHFLAFSPEGNDGHYPHENIRRAIEKYGNEDLKSGFVSSIINSRGCYVVNAGKSEHEIAEKYRENRDWLRSKYYKTARIYDELTCFYENASTEERERAESMVI